MEFMITYGKSLKSALSDTIPRWIKQDELGKTGIQIFILHIAAGEPQQVRQWGEWYFNK